LLEKLPKSEFDIPKSFPHPWFTPGNLPDSTAFDQEKKKKALPTPNGPTHPHLQKGQGQGEDREEQA
jgi:hypothetical protein